MEALATGFWGFVGGTRRKNPGNKQGDSATAIAIGALMYGIPESAAIGISLLGGGNISAALVAAVPMHISGHFCRHPRFQVNSY